MKNILLIATGGTIVSKESENGLVPQVTSSEILDYIPESRKICNITTVQLFNIDSSNITPFHWLRIKNCIQKNYGRYDGFVITHGTDTMAYTASALSYLIQNSYKPIVLTGAQKSIVELDTDARKNLLNAIIFAADDNACGVKIVFDNNVIIGTRARKTRTRSYNAFQSVDYPSIAIFRNNRPLYYIEEKKKYNVIFHDSLDPNIFLLKLIPGTDLHILSLLKEKYDAVIVESFGMGGLPGEDKEKLAAILDDYLSSGKVLVMATQVPYEGSDLSVYEVGTFMKNRENVLEASTMTLESVVCKLMWILSKTKDTKEIHRLFYLPIDKDILI